MSEAVESKRMDGWDGLDISYHTVQPNRWTFKSEKIREWVESYCRGRVLNACAGKTELSIETVRNDLDESIGADAHVDVCELADHFDSWSFDTIIFDPPFSLYQANKHYDGRQVNNVALAKRQFHQLLRAGGRVIQFGYTTTCMPAAWDYHREAVAVFNTLGQMNDILGTVDRRQSADIQEFGGGR